MKPTPTENRTFGTSLTNKTHGSSALSSLFNSKFNARSKNSLDSNNLINYLNLPSTIQSAKNHINANNTVPLMTNNTITNIENDTANL